MILCWHFAFVSPLSLVHVFDATTKDVYNEVDRRGERSVHDIVPGGAGRSDPFVWGESRHGAGNAW